MDAVGDLDAQLQAADQGSVAPPTGAAGDAGAPPVVDDSAKWVGMVHQVGPILREMVPATLRQDWTGERFDAIGAALANCARHYGWKFSDALTHPLLGLGMACFPLAWPLVSPMLLGAPEKKPVPATEAPTQEAGAVPVETPTPGPKPEKTAPVG